MAAVAEFDCEPDLALPAAGALSPGMDVSPLIGPTPPNPTLPCTLTRSSSSSSPSASFPSMVDTDRRFVRAGVRIGYIGGGGRLPDDPDAFRMEEVPPESARAWEGVTMGMGGSGGEDDRVFLWSLTGGGGGTRDDPSASSSMMALGVVGLGVSSRRLTRRMVASLGLRGSSLLVRGG